MKASEVIMKKLRNENNGFATIKQLNGNITNFYFVTNETFWSDNLNSLSGDGYGFEIFDILEGESKRFKDRKIPKGNSRNHKLGEEKCDNNTAIGILGYRYYKKKDGDSILDPIHVFAAILEWSGIARNKRGFIEFINQD